MKSIDELAIVGRGRSRHRPRNDPSLYDGEHPFIQTADIHNADLNITSFSQTYSEKGLEQSKYWEPGTICITNAGENTGDSAILGIRACFPDSIIGVVADPDKADTVFLKYAIDRIKPQLRKVTRGATQDNLSLEKLLAFKFSMPPINIQRKIGDVLARYGELIENNRQRMKLLEESARLLYQEWFVRLRFPGHERVRIVNEVPEGWAKKTAYEAMHVMSGGTPKTTTPDFWDGDIPFYTPKDSVDACYVLDTEKHLTEMGLRNCNSKLYPKDTIFITARGTVGNLNLAQQPMAMNQSCYALANRGDISQKVLFCSLSEAIQQFRQKAGGAVFDAIIVDTFKLIPFVIPDKKIVALFEEFIEPIFNQIENLLLQNHKLKFARKSMLPRLMNREIAL